MRVIRLGASAVLIVVAVVVAVTVFSTVSGGRSPSGNSPEETLRNDAARSDGTLYLLSGAEMPTYPVDGPGWEIVFQAWPSGGGEIPVAVVTYLHPDVRVPAHYLRRPTLITRVARPNGEVVRVFARGTSPSEEIAGASRRAIRPVASA